MDQFWDEMDFEFEGIPATLYDWPADRPISLKTDSGDEVQVPTFHFDSCGGLEENMHNCVEAQINYLKDHATIEPIHLHVIRIPEYPEQVGLIIHSEKLTPVTDFFISTDQQERERRRKKGTANPAP